MQKINSMASLKDAIIVLEIKQKKESLLLKEQLLTTYDYLKPRNLIKTTLSEIIASPGFKKNIFNTTLSVALGYLSKKAAIGSTNNPIKKLLGTFLQMGVTSLVSKNAEGIKFGTIELIKNIFQKNNPSQK